MLNEDLVPGLKDKQFVYDIGKVLQPIGNLFNEMGKAQEIILHEIEAKQEDIGMNSEH